MIDCLRKSRWIAGLLFLGAFAGCGGSSDQPELGDVSGIVTLDGDPVIGVNVVFKPDIGRAAAGNTNLEGRYTLEYLAGVEGCKLGPNTVSFDWPPGTPLAIGIPAKYSGAEQFKFDVKPGSNDFDLKMESDGTETEVPMEEE
ncbi:MAG: hypothetical protein WKF77_06915 [Planctomycetaceae bacterium]